MANQDRRTDLLGKTVIVRVGDASPTGFWGRLGRAAKVIEIAPGAISRGYHVQCVSTGRRRWVCRNDMYLIPVARRMGKEVRR